MLLGLKGKFLLNRLLGESECWATKKQDEHKTSVAEIRKQKWMCRKIRSSEIGKDKIYARLKVGPIEDKMRVSFMVFWAYKRHVSAPVRKYQNIDLVVVSKGRGRFLNM